MKLLIRRLSKSASFSGTRCQHSNCFSQGRSGRMPVCGLRHSRATTIACSGKGHRETGHRTVVGSNCAKEPPCARSQQCFRFLSREGCGLFDPLSLGRAVHHSGTSTSKRFARRRSKPRDEIGRRELDAGNRHVRLNERGRETECRPSPKPPRPSSTLRLPTQARS